MHTQVTTTCELDILHGAKIPKQCYATMESPYDRHTRARVVLSVALGGKSETQLLGARLPLFRATLNYQLATATDWDTTVSQSTRTPPGALPSGNPQDSARDHSVPFVQPF